MSSGPQTVVGACMYRTSAASRVRYTNGSDGATSLCHVGIFSGACSDCHIFLLNSLHTRRGMPLTNRLKSRRGLFLDSTSMLFVWQIRKWRATRR